MDRWRAASMDCTGMVPAVQDPAVPRTKHPLVRAASSGVEKRSLIGKRCSYSEGDLERVTRQVAELASPDAGVVARSTRSAVGLLSTANSDNHRMLVNIGAVTLLLDVVRRMLGEGGDQAHTVAAHALMALSNLTIGDVFRRHVLEAGAFKCAAFALGCDSPVKSLHQYALNVIMNLSATENLFFNSDVDKDCVDVLLDYLLTAEDELALQVIMSLENMLDHEQFIDILLESEDASRRLVTACLSHTAPEKRRLNTGFLKVLVSMSASDGAIKTLSRAGVLSVIDRMLSTPDDVVRDLTTKLMTNVALNEDNAAAIINSRVPTHLQHALQRFVRHPDQAMQEIEQTLMVLTNLTRTRSATLTLLNLGFLDTLVALVSCRRERILVCLAKVMNNIATFDEPRSMLLQTGIRTNFLELASSPNDMLAYYAGLAAAKLSLPTSSMYASFDVMSAEEAEKKLVEYNEHRKKVISEIVETEKSYVHSLVTICKVFREPILKEELLSVSVVDTIFANVEDLMEMHCSFLSSLEKKVQSTQEEEVAIGEVFLALTACLTTYEAYVSNYDQSIIVLSAQLDRAKFSDFVSRQQEATQCQKLENLLVNPIQRIPRYALLLRDLVKHMPQSHADAEKVTLALERVLDIMNFLEEQKAKVEALRKLASIRENLEGLGESLVNDLRAFVSETDLAVLDEHKSKLDERMYWLFLFNDLLVYAKKKPSGKFNVKLKFDLIDINCLDVEGSEAIILKKEEKFRFCFSDTIIKRKWVKMVKDTKFRLQKEWYRRKAGHMSQALE